MRATLSNHLAREMVQALVPPEMQQKVLRQSASAASSVRILIGRKHIGCQAPNFCNRRAAEAGLQPDLQPGHQH